MEEFHINDFSLKNTPRNLYLQEEPHHILAPALKNSTSTPLLKCAIMILTLSDIFKAHYIVPVKKKKKEEEWHHILTDIGDVF